jgi:hypothetical protein
MTGDHGLRRLSRIPDLLRKLSRKQVPPVAQLDQGIRRDKPRDQDEKAQSHEYHSIPNHAQSPVEPVAPDDPLDDPRPVEVGTVALVPLACTQVSCTVVS